MYMHLCYYCMYIYPLKTNMVSWKIISFLIGDADTSSNTCFHCHVIFPGRRFLDEHMLPTESNVICLLYFVMKFCLNFQRTSYAAGGPCRTLPYELPGPCAVG